LIPFTKAHACGNDFLIVTEESASGHDQAELTRRLCERNTGIGADGIEFFAWTGANSGRIRLHNADGSVAEISGNGTRCVAAWMAASISSQTGDILEITTDAGLRVCRVNSIDVANGYSVQITAGMGFPTIAAHNVTLTNDIEIAGANAWIIRSSPSPGRPGKPSAQGFAFIPISRSKPTSCSSASSVLRKSKSASSSAASVPPIHPALAVPHRQLRP